MPWFRVDDSFWGHPKAIAAGPALALWLRAGCWCAQQLTDGFVRRDALPMLGGNPAMAKRLVDARSTPDGSGLWVVVDGGWVFHDWADYQPSKDDVEADRAAARDRMKRARESKRRGPGSREVRANTRRTGTVDNYTASPMRGPQGEIVSEIDLQRNIRETHLEGPPEALGTHSDQGRRENVRPNFRRSSDNPGPARPGPTYLQTLISRLAALETGARNAPPPAEEVIASWQELAGPDVDLDAEAVAYLQRFGDRPANDERGAWLGWLRTARKRADTARTAPGDSAPSTRRPACSHPGCVGGWLADDPTTGRAIPCPTCKPHRMHLQPVPESDAREAS